MTILHVPVTFSSIIEWVRKAAGAINQLITGKQDQSDNLTSIAGLDLTGHAGDVLTVLATVDGFELLPAGGGGGGVSDGDKGDITVGGSGATWTIDNDVVTYGKIQNVSATNRFLGRITGGAGDIEELTAANAKTILGLVQADISGLTTADSPQFTAINLGHASDTTITRVSAGVVAIEGVNIVTTAGGITFSNDVSVPAEAYGSGWNGSNEAPTKNDVYDKIESLTAGALVLLTQQAASASASLDFTGFISATYDEYQFELVDLVLATDNVDFLVRMSTDGGSTYDTGAGTYAYGFNQVGGTNFHSGVSTNSTTSITLAQGVDNASTNSINGTMKLFAPSQTSRHKNVNFQVSCVKNDNNFYNDIGAGRYKSTSAVNGIRFIASSGNITSGAIRVYGIVK